MQKNVTGYILDHLWQETLHFCHIQSITLHSMGSKNSKAIKGHEPHQ